MNLHHTNSYKSTPETNLDIYNLIYMIPVFIMKCLKPKIPTCEKKTIYQHFHLISNLYLKIFLTYLLYKQITAQQRSFITYDKKINFKNNC